MSSTITKDRLIYDSGDIADSDKLFTTIIDTSDNAVGTTDVSGTRGLDVNVLNDIDVDLDHANDSVRIGDGTNLVTVTQNGADYGLDVNLINTSIAVTATDTSDNSTTANLTITVPHDKKNAGYGRR